MSYVFFFNDTATTEIYTLSLHDALPICTDDETRGDQHNVLDNVLPLQCRRIGQTQKGFDRKEYQRREGAQHRSEEHTSELQSRQHLVCRLLLEKKKTQLHPPPFYPLLPL